MINHYIKEHRKFTNRDEHAVMYCGQVVKYLYRAKRTFPKGHAGCFINNDIHNREKPGEETCVQCDTDTRVDLDLLADTEL